MGNALRSDLSRSNTVTPAKEVDFDTFFRVEQPKMVALALALTGVPEVARDLAQDSLPERQRAAVALHYLEDMSIAEVAEALDIAEGTVKASLFKARSALANALGVPTDRPGGAA